MRRAVEVAKTAWMMKLVGEINSRESADDQRPLSPMEVWQVIRALQKGPRLAVPITPLNLPVAYDPSINLHLLITLWRATERRRKV